MFVRLLGPLLLGASIVAGPLHAQRVHQVRLIHATGDLFRFEPNRVEARPGEALEFVVESGGPYVIGFEPLDLTETGRTLLDQAIPNHSGPLRGPVLAGPGSQFRIILPSLPRGGYRFVSITHLAYRMGGLLVIK
jgi:plastocyanin